MNEIIVNLEGKEYQIDIQKAKELGVIKEKDQRCKSWEEFKLKYKNNRGYYYDFTKNEMYKPVNPWGTGEQLTPQETIAIQTFSKLLKLRRDWIGTWEPDWCGSERNYCVVVTKNHYTTHYFYSDHHTFSFPTEEMAKEFLECFKHLFEDCKSLI